jgi:hypothetical protein
MSKPDPEEFDRLTLSRAIQYGFRLQRKESSTGELVFEWRAPNSDTGPQFASRRIALEWMDTFLEHTPAHGISLFPKESDTSDT